MPIIPGGVGFGGSGAGLTLGPPTNTFTAASETLAETARDTYATANATWLAQYDANPTFTIALSWPVTPTNTKYQARRGGSWADVTPIIRGPSGDDGEQGRFPIIQHTNSAGQPTPDTPTGGSYVQSTGVFTPSTGATEDPTPPGVGEDVWASQALINPELDPDTIDLSGRWSEWVERSHLSAGISHVEVVAGELTGTGLPVSPIGLDPSRLFEANPTGIATESLETVDLGGTLYTVDELVDVTNVGLPSLNIDNYRRLFADHDTPRAWIGHREIIAATPAVGDWFDYTTALFRGAFDDLTLATNPQVGEYLYYHLAHGWYTANVVNGLLRFRSSSFESIFSGVGGVWLGEQPDDDTAVALIDNFTTSHNYYFFRTSDEIIRVLNTATFIEAVGRVIHYVAEPISAPTGVGSIAGVTAGEGLTGGGLSGVVTVNVDPTESDFPTIPIDKGGTGETTAAAALAALGGTDDQSGPEIAALLEALTGTARLSAVDALRLLADALDAELGQTTWRTGGALTAAQIVGLLEALTGDDRLNATTAIRLIADALDTELGQADWRRGEDEIASHTYVARGATWDAANHTIEATVTGLTTLENGDEFILVLPSALPGQGTSDASLSLNGESRLLFRPLDDGLGRVPSRELVPSSIVLLFRSNVGYRFLEPHVLERAGTWSGGRIYLRGQDVIRGTTDYKLLNETSVGEDPATHPEVWLPFPHTWQFGGITLGPTITGINFEGAGVVSSVNNGIWTLTIAAGGVPPEPPTDDFYWGTSADATPEGAELTIAAVNGAATIPAYVGSMHVLIARLATEDDLMRVVRSDDISQTNQLGGFTKFGSTIIPTGETLAFKVWVSNQNLTQSADVIWTAS